MDVVSTEPVWTPPEPEDFVATLQQASDSILAHTVPTAGPVILYADPQAQAVLDASEDNDGSPPT